MLSDGKIGDARIIDGCTLYFENGYVATVVGSPLFTLLGGCIVRLDYSPPGCDDFWVRVDNVGSEWSVVDSDGVPLPGLIINKVFDKNLGYVYRRSGISDSDDNRAPSCNCSLTWMDSSEESWPHKKDCAYLKYMREKREEERKAKEYERKNKR